MRLERHLSPGRLAALSLLGAALLYVLLFASVAFADLEPRLFAHHRLLSVAVFVAISALAGWIVLSGQGALHRGLLDDLWPDAVVDRLRRTLVQERWTRLVNGSSLLGIGCIFADLLSHHAPYAHQTPWGAFTYFVIAPAVALGKLRSELRPLRADPWWKSPAWRETLKPIVSEHWGK